MNRHYHKKLLLINIVLIFALGIMPSFAKSKTYYVDSISGRDSNSGIDQRQAWQSITKINRTTFHPGDSILFKRGRVWRGKTLLVTSSGTVVNPIIFGAYGPGAMLPKITVATLIRDSAWKHAPNGEYYYQDASLDGHIVLLDKQRRMTGKAVGNSLPGPKSGQLKPGEWAWNKHGRLYYKPLGRDAPENIELVSGSGKISLKTNGRNNLIIQDLEFYGGYRQIVRVENSNNVQLIDCDIHSGYRGLEIHKSNNVYISDNRVYDINYKGIGVVNGTTHTTVINNHVFDIGRLNVDDGDLEGILVGGGRNHTRPSHVIIENNLIENIGRDHYKHKDGKVGAGTMLSVGIEIDAVTNVILVRNIIRRTWRVGIRINASSAITRNVDIHSNLIYDIGHMTSLDWISGGIHIASTQGYGISDIDIFNNTVANSTFESNSGGEAGVKILVYDRKTNKYPYGSKVYGLRFVNNIIQNKGDYLLAVSVRKNDGLRNFSFDNNLYWKTSGGGIMWSIGGRVKSKIYNSDRIIGSRSGYYNVDSNQDRSSLYNKPKFINPTKNNFHLYSTSSAVDAGKHSDRDTDYDGKPIVGIPDIGAFENQQ